MVEKSAPHAIVPGGADCDNEPRRLGGGQLAEPCVSANDRYAVKFRAGSVRVGVEHHVRQGGIGCTESIENHARVNWTGVGSSEPLYLTPSDPANRARNRRVEIIHIGGI